MIGVRSRMNILWTGCSRKLAAGSLSGTKKLKTLSDGSISRVELRGASICVDGIGYLIVTALVQASEIEPNFGNIWIYSNRAGVSVESVTVLVDLEIEDAD